MVQDKSQNSLKIIQLLKTAHQYRTRQSTKLNPPVEERFQPSLQFCRQRTYGQNDANEGK